MERFVLPVKYLVSNIAMEPFVNMILCAWLGTAYLMSVLHAVGQYLDNTAIMLHVPLTINALKEDVILGLVKVVVILMISLVMDNNALKI
jgi:hypothetical protein